MFAADHYRLIWNAEMVREFDELLNVDLEGDRVRVAMLLARAKYLTPETRGNFANGDLKNLHLTRRLVRRPRELLRALRSYEIPTGTYVCRDSRSGAELPIPDGCLALYVTVRARSCLAAYNELTSKFQKLLTEACLSGESTSRLETDGRTDHENSPGRLETVGRTDRENSPVSQVLEFASRLESEFKGAVHRSVCSSAPQLLDLDVDSKEPSHLRSLGQVLRPVADRIVARVETRGGFHVVMNKDLIKNVLPSLHALAKASRFESTSSNGKKVTKHWLSISSDGMIPVPGTIQGGFCVQLLPRTFRFESEK